MLIKYQFLPLNPYNNQNTIDTTHNSLGYKGQSVIVATYIKPQSSFYYKSASGYKIHRLLRPLEAGPQAAAISRVHCITVRRAQKAINLSTAGFEATQKNEFETRSVFPK